MKYTKGFHRKGCSFAFICISFRLFGNTRSGYYIAVLHYICPKLLKKAKVLSYRFLEISDFKY